MTLPKPTLTFTVPSLHDGLPIDCRLYHPASLAASPDAPAWRKHAAVFAHPYAPLGGCYDDGIVNLVASTLLNQGFLVCTFNFRGAHGSAGRTSWTAKPERADYTSVVGFLLHYAHLIDPFRPSLRKIPIELPDREPAADGEETSQIRIRAPTPNPQDGSEISPVFLSGGYSYGAMITSQLPSLAAISALFDTPEYGSHAAEIRLRAQHLAETQNTVLAAAREAAADRLRPASPRRYVGLRVGGDEEARKSHEMRRSLSAEFEEAIRHGVHELIARTRKVHKEKTEGPDGTAAEVPSTQKQQPSHLPPIPDRTAFRPAYLLVSPLQGVITNLATMSFPSLSSISAKSWGRQSAKDNELMSEASSEEAESKLVQNPTLAIYGDDDVFVPVRKLRAWKCRLEAMQSSKFRAHEVPNAGHFWAQGNVASTLREAVRAFASSLLEDGAG
ncbi:hypothetical protein VTJ49DRAFT_2196 [Mycothermus thermophilus]|uniref:Peptidase S9 prolyl oligopeptidase catalytic domain-containing protein n=1 Tax=Humicola insolens TaxID=85995 RepID=A0ABR3VC93_HUMIN